MVVVEVVVCGWRSSWRCWWWCWWCVGGGGGAAEVIFQVTEIQILSLSLSLSRSLSLFQWASAALPAPVCRPWEGRKESERQRARARTSFVYPTLWYIAHNFLCIFFLRGPLLSESAGRRWQGPRAARGCRYSTAGPRGPRWPLAGEKSHVCPLIPHETDPTSNKKQTNI